VENQTHFPNWKNSYLEELGKFSVFVEEYNAVVEIFANHKLQPDERHAKRIR